jgi:hypothetical protein
VGDEFFGYITDTVTEQEVYEDGVWHGVETALAWARERADQVVLTYGGGRDSVFSAGVRYHRGAADAPLPQWPPDRTVIDAIDQAVRDEPKRRPRPGKLGVVRPMIVQDDPVGPGDE